MPVDHTEIISCAHNIPVSRYHTYTASQTNHLSTPQFDVIKHVKVLTYNEAIDTLLWMSISQLNLEAVFLTTSLAQYQVLYSVSSLCLLQYFGIPKP